jgi:peroxiredoxin
MVERSALATIPESLIPEPLIVESLVAERLRRPPAIWHRNILVRLAFVCCSFAFLVSSARLLAQQPPARQNMQVQAALDKAQRLEDERKFSDAIDAYKKADKLDGGTCVLCLSHLYQLYEQGGDNKHAAESAAQLEQLVTLPADKATAALSEGAALLREATSTKKRALFQQADAQFQVALHYQPDAAQPLFLDGLALGRMGDDAGAKAAFARYVASKQADPIMQARARRYLADIDLVRQNMAPAFSIDTLQGEILDLDNMQGRVVLLDFWATWNQASVSDLPHIQHIVQRFQGQPLVVIGVSLDTDPAKLQKFVAEHDLSWPQFLDKGGRMATTFGVRALPQYFTIDANGVLSPQDLGSGAGLENRLKKLVAQARQMEERPAPKSGPAE